MRVLMTEEKLQTVIDNYATMDKKKLAELVGITESTLLQWVCRFRKSLKNKGISDSVIDRYFPRTYSGLPNMQPTIDKLLDNLIKR